jgi:RNA polymerase sigma-70 factor (ECF subfamily)
MGRTYEAGALAFWHQVRENGSEVTDESLIQGILSRDEAALAVLYSRYATMVYSEARLILTAEGAAEGIIPQVFYRIWLKACDFKAAGSTVPEFLLATARKCAYDQFLGSGFEIGGPFPLGQCIPAFNVDLMARVRKIMADLPPSESVPRGVDNPTGSDWAQADSHSQGLIVALRSKIRATLKALRELPLGGPGAIESRKQEKS